jgi:hypothetical protein
LIQINAAPAASMRRISPRWKPQETQMTLGEKLYLVLVLAAFASFAVALAYQTHADKQWRAGK